MTETPISRLGLQGSSEDFVSRLVLDEDQLRGEVLRQDNEIRRLRTRIFNLQFGLAVAGVVVIGMFVLIALSA